MKTQMFTDFFERYGRIIFVCLVIALVLTIFYFASHPFREFISRSEVYLRNYNFLN